MIHSSTLRSPLMARLRGLALALLVALLGSGLTLAGCGGPPPPKKIKKAKKKKKTPKKVKKAKTDQVPEVCAPHDKELADAFAPYLDAFTNVGHELSPNGKTLLFRSNRGGGSYQLYTAPARKGSKAPTVIAQAKDGVRGARFTPDGKYIIFTRDKDKDENTQIYRATPDGAEVKALTEAPGKYHRLPQITADGLTLVYFRGEHKMGTITLVSQSIEGGEAKTLYKGKGFMFLTDLTRDGSKALVFSLKSLSESVLSLVDLKTGKARRLAPAKGKKAHAHMSAFSADEKSVYVVTDADGEVAGLNRVDLESGEVKAMFNDFLAEAADVRVDPRGKTVAVLLDAGSHQAMKFLSPDSLEEGRVVKLPQAGLRLGEYTADGKGVVLTVSAPDTPTDVFMVDVKRGRIKPLRSDKRPGLRKLAKVSISVERIDTFDKFKVPVNVYLPAKLKRDAKLPVIVGVHGGPAAASSIGWSPMTSFWISRGFAYVEPNVRGSTGFGKGYEKADNLNKRMDAVKDLEHVNSWIRKQPWADPDRIVIFGGSYGGYMVYMAMGHQAGLWNAGIGLVGVVNLRTFLRNTTGAIRMVFKDEFGSLPKDGKFLDSVSPIRVVKKVKAPLFIYQGANDPRVPRSEQDQLVHALRKVGVPVEYMVAEDEGHSLSQRDNKLEFVSRTARFMAQHLKLPGLSDECLNYKPLKPKKAKKSKKKKTKKTKKKKTKK